MTRLIGGLDRLVAAILSGGRWLLLPVVLLLFLQWPLRDIFRAWSRDANDLGQWLFALYVAMCFTAATRAHTHLAADALARHYSQRTRLTLARLGALLSLLPWSLYTYNPGYFVIKLALWLLAGLVLMQAVIDIARPRSGAA
jgi:TRAP-type mannitol/chloroaromatic compound transport system permease small subunit